MSEKRVVGKVKDAHGIKGEIYITLFPREAAWLDKLKAVSLKPTETAVEAKEFTVKSARLHKGGLIIKTHEIPDRNAAEALKGYFFEIPEEFLVSEKGEALYLSEIDGFEVRENGAKIGTIIGFSSNGAHDLLIVKTKNGEFDIPFVDAFVITLDHENKFIDMDLPEGLFDTDDAQDQDRSEEEE